MEIPLDLQGFEGRRLAVQTPGVLSNPKLYVDGAPAPRGPKRGQYLLRRNDGSEVVVSFKSVFPDPMPQLRVGDELIRLVRPMAWYEWIWAALPLVLLFVGGAIGGMAGAVGTMLNASILRSEMNVVFRYALCAVVTCGAVLMWLAIVLAIQ